MQKYRFMAIWHNICSDEIPHWKRENPMNMQNLYSLSKSHLPFTSIDAEKGIDKTATKRSVMARATTNRLGIVCNWLFLYTAKQTKMFPIKEAILRITANVASKIITPVLLCSRAMARFLVESIITLSSIWTDVVLSFRIFKNQILLLPPSLGAALSPFQLPCAINDEYITYESICHLPKLLLTNELTFFVFKTRSG